VFFLSRSVIPSVLGLATSIKGGLGRERVFDRRVDGVRFFSGRVLGYVAKAEMCVCVPKIQRVAVQVVH